MKNVQIRAANPHGSDPDQNFPACRSRDRERLEREFLNVLKNQGLRFAADPASLRHTDSILVADFRDLAPGYLVDGNTIPLAALLFKRFGLTGDENFRRAGS